MSPLVFNNAYVVILTTTMFQTAFLNSGMAIIKTAVMMTGEFEYEGIFFKDGEGGKRGKGPSVVLAFPEITIMFFIAFLIVMSIIIVNLLVGLAVDDIKEVREAAALKKAALQVICFFL